MRTIRLDISNDVFDNVMFFLENLPKNKVKLKVEKNVLVSKKGFNPKDFFGVANSSKVEIDKFLEENKGSWDSFID